MPPVLEAEALVSGYGRVRILDGVSLSLAAGEIVGLVGHNGMGKTTLLRTLIGHLPTKAGRIHFAGRDITYTSAAARARLGVGYVPQGRQIFPDLTVIENLRVGEAARSGPSGIPMLLEQFPPLKALLRRPGRALSGGEQQLLALARCLLGRPTVVLLDEPSEGIQPSIVERLARHLRDLSAGQGLGVLLAEQDLQLVAQIAQSVLVMRKGRIVAQISANDLTNPTVRRELLSF